MVKVLNRKAYGSIPHLEYSNIHAGDKRIDKGQSDICTMKARDKHDQIVVQEKLDGACVGVARVRKDALLYVTRSGHDAGSSRFAHHKLFKIWAQHREGDFIDLLDVGEMAVGEWMSLSHSIRYDGLEAPFYIFDIIDMNYTGRNPRHAHVIYNVLAARVLEAGFHSPITAPGRDPILPSKVWHRVSRISIREGQGEGLVYRVERHGKLEFTAKWVRQAITPGLLLDDESPTYNRIKCVNGIMESGYEVRYAEYRHVNDTHLFLP